MKRFQVTKGSLLITSLTNAHSNALNELIIRNGEFASEEEISSIAGLRGIDFQSFIHSQASHLDENFQMFLTKKYVEQWINSFTSAQQSLIDLTQL
jgi:hypothetical protein